MKEIYLEDAIVPHPEINTTYYIFDKDSNKKIIARFIGDKIPEFSYIDLTGLTSCQGTQLESYHFKDPFFSKDALPPSSDLKYGSPLFNWMSDTKRLLEVNEITIHFNSGQNNLLDSHFCTKGNRAHKNMEHCNVTLQKECQALAGDIPVVSGDYPIFFKDNPSFEVLSDLYQKFINYNDNYKLSKQYENSKSKCFMRAHVSTVLCDLHGINTAKLYKIYNQNDWQKFVANKSWWFHCASMLIDNQNRKWVWDPWVGFNQRLLTLDEWLNKKDEPRPIKLKIMNKAIITDLKFGSTPEAYKFLKTKSSYMINAFQAVFSDAVPNPPERPLSNKNYFIPLSQSSFKDNKNTFFGSYSDRVVRYKEMCREKRALNVKKMRFAV